MDSVASIARRTWIGPAAIGAAGLASCVVVSVRDPNVGGSYAVCPFLALTGHDCPGCGLLRGTHAALEGDLAGALDHNVLWPVVIGLILWTYVRWTKQQLGMELREVRLPTWAPVALSVFLLSFWVVRNLGGPFTYLEA